MLNKQNKGQNYISQMSFKDTEGWDFFKKKKLEQMESQGLKLEFFLKKYKY